MTIRMPPGTWIVRKDSGWYYTGRDLDDRGPFLGAPEARESAWSEAFMAAQPGIAKPRAQTQIDLHPHYLLGD